MKQNRRKRVLIVPLVSGESAQRCSEIAEILELVLPNHNVAVVSGMVGHALEIKR